MVTCVEGNFYYYVLSLNKQGMFEPFMKSFYVRSTDATHIKTLKVMPTLCYNIVFDVFEKACVQLFKFHL